MLYWHNFNVSPYHLFIKTPHWLWGLHELSRVPYYPGEDEKLRASKLSRRRGGNCPICLESLKALSCEGCQSSLVCNLRFGSNQLFYNLGTKIKVGYRTCIICLGTALTTRTFTWLREKSSTSLSEVESSMNSFWFKAPSVFIHVMWINQKRVANSMGLRIERTGRMHALLALALVCRFESSGFKDSYRKSWKGDPFILPFWK